MTAILIPLLLNCPSNVKLAIWTTAGSCLTVIKNEFMDAGDYELSLSAHEIGLPPTAYIYQLEVQNETGIFCRYKRFSVTPAQKNKKRLRKP